MQQPRVLYGKIFPFSLSLKCLSQSLCLRTRCLSLQSQVQCMSGSWVTYNNKEATKNILGQQGKRDCRMHCRQYHRVSVKHPSSDGVSQLQRLLLCSGATSCRVGDCRVLMSITYFPMAQSALGLCRGREGRERTQMQHKSEQLVNGNEKVGILYFFF